MALFKFRPDSETSLPTPMSRIEGQILLDGIVVGAVLMYAYFDIFGNSTRLVKIIGASITVLLVIPNYANKRADRKEKKKDKKDE